jgi:hypothetical protein
MEFASPPRKIPVTSQNFMFTVHEHMFKAHEHMFKGDEHKFTVREHKIFVRMAHFVLQERPNEMTDGKE